MLAHLSLVDDDDDDDKVTTPSYLPLNVKRD
jgi:hypothetical protein